MADYVITLIHGTFARGADWCKEHSNFAQALKNKGHNVEIEQFDWSGLNLHSARIEAGQRLETELRKKIEQDASVKRVLIAHSHGGNVVLYALRDPTIAAGIDSIVTLGTPFISISDRPVRAALNWLLTLIVFQSMALPVLIWLSVFGHLIDHTDYFPARHSKYRQRDINEYLKNSAMATMIVACVCYLFASYLSEMKHDLLSKIQIMQNKWISQFELPSCSTRMLCIGVHKDEARAALSSSAILCELAAFFLTSFTLFGLVFAATFLRISETEGMNGYLAVFLIVVALAIAPIVVGIQYLVTSVFFEAVRGSAFGEIFGLQAVLLVVKPTLLPRAETAAEFALFRVRRFWQFRRPIAHSLVYTDAAVSDCVAKFVYSENAVTEYAPPYCGELKAFT